MYVEDHVLYGFNSFFLIWWILFSFPYLIILAKTLYIEENYKSGHFSHIPDFSAPHQ